MRKCGRSINRQTVFDSGKKQNYRTDNSAYCCITQTVRTENFMAYKTGAFEVTTC